MHLPAVYRLHFPVSPAKAGAQVKPTSLSG
jgi:hypothetical protein